MTGERQGRMRHVKREGKANTGAGKLLWSDGCGGIQRDVVGVWWRDDGATARCVVWRGVGQPVEEEAVAITVLVIQYAKVAIAILDVRTTPKGIRLSFLN